MKKRNMPDKTLHKLNRSENPLLDRSTGKSANAAGAAKSAKAADSVQPLSLEEKRDAKLRAVEKRKTRSRMISMTIIFMIILIFSVFLIINIMKKVAPKPQFMFISNGKIEHIVGATGLIIRDDVLMKAPVSGIIKPLIEEGSRVSFGQDIAIIINQGSEKSLLALKNCEQQIADLQKELINKGKGPGARVIYEETDKNIAEIINLARKESINESLVNMGSYEASIAVMLERRNTRLLSIEFSDARLNELKKQKQDLEKALGLFAGTIRSQTSGIVSYYLDGLEDEITMKNIDAMTLNQYNDYIKRSANYLSTEDLAVKDKVILRITSGIYQYIVFLLPNTTLDFFENDSMHTINIPLDGTTIPNCRVYKAMIIKDDMFVIFKTDRQLDRFSDRRILQADISAKTTEGLKIPLTSIINFNKVKNTGEIMIVSGGYTRISKVNIIDYDREYAIIEGIKNQTYLPSLHGYLVKNPEAIKEGENIGGTT